jgi:CBS domain-containing protein
LVLPIDGLIRPVAAVLNYLGIVNIALALFNMVPGFPLDGGRMLRSTLWHFTGSLRQATRWASLSGQGFGYLLVGYGLFRIVLARDFGGLWMVFVGWFLYSAAQSAYQQLLLQRALCGVSVSDLMTNEVPQVDGDMRIPEFVTGYVLQHDYSTYPVVRLGEFMGIVSIDDVRHLDRSLWGVTCVGALAHQPDGERVVAHNQDAWGALKQMVENDAPRLLVIDDGRLQGIISREAIMRLVQMEARLGVVR